MPVNIPIHPPRTRGLFIALTILVLWAGLLAFLLNYPVQFTNPLTYIFILLQTHLYTGLFITAHDAMHGVVSSNKKLNHTMGWICATLFAFNNYNRLNRKHHMHHKHVATGEDPDYHQGGFLRWYASFLMQYVTVWQFLFMAITFNLLKLVFPTENLILFWMLPAVLSTFQLFIFGTYLPHRGDHSHDNKHKARSQPTNHVLAFISCYFFGYHYEHHSFPYLPWWRLPKAKEELDKANS
jgi:beta-carotene/zeaxanthin 4-ketolase